MRRLAILDDAWATTGGGARLDAVERAAPRLRDAIRESGTVLAVRTFDIATFPYPARYAFQGVMTIPVPYVWMANRAVLIEYRDHESARRRLLVNPTWPEGSKRAPYFQQLEEKLPHPALERVLSKQGAALPDQLRAAGVDPASIDFITFDHLHVQDLRPMLGPRGFWPRARLLLTKEERAIVGSLHPLQRNWYVAGGFDGVRDEDVVTFDGDLLLGEGVALVRTPGHTDGNHTIAFALSGGLVTISENGVAADCYAPGQSKIPGLRAYAEKSGAQVVLNANTRERTLDQYTSMRLEQVLAGGNAEWPRHFSSSELVSHPLAPGVTPTHAVREITHGVVGT